jgi:hypothetical protein
MALIEIPTRSDLKAYEFQIELDGVVYTLSIRWNQRMGRWIMDIADADGVDLLNGIPLLTNIPLTDDYVKAGLPPGRFICEDTTGGSKIAGVDDLGNDVRLIYEEAGA